MRLSYQEVPGAIVGVNFGSRHACLFLLGRGADRCQMCLWPPFCSLQVTAGHSLPTTLMSPVHLLHVFVTSLLLLLLHSCAPCNTSCTMVFKLLSRSSMVIAGCCLLHCCVSHTSLRQIRPLSLLSGLGVTQRITVLMCTNAHVGSGLKCKQNMLCPHACLIS